MIRHNPVQAKHAYLCKNFSEGLYPFKLNGGHEAALLLSVAPDCTLTSIALPMPGWSGNTGVADLSVLPWAGDYAASRAGTPVFTGSMTSVPDNGRVTFHIPAGVVTAGAWLLVLHNGQGNPVGVYFTAKDDGEGDVTVTQAFTDGAPVGEVIRAYATYEKNIPTQSDDRPLTKLTPGKAHVIFLSGQSNASGQSMVHLYKEHTDPALFEKLSGGFDHILIDVAVDGGTLETNGFVPVALGQGATTERFGPEVGLAMVLDETYPGETFYIIKSAWSGAGLTHDLQAESPVCQYIMNKTAASLERLRGMGLEPEIFALCWMQGETDSWYPHDTAIYAEQMEDFVARVIANCPGAITPTELAVADAAISDTYAWTLNGMINVQKQIFASRSPNRYYLDTVTPGLGCEKENDDIAHYDSDDMMEVGRLFGEAVCCVIENGR